MRENPKCARDANVTIEQEKILQMHKMLIKWKKNLQSARDTNVTIH